MRAIKPLGGAFVLASILLTSCSGNSLSVPTKERPDAYDFSGTHATVGDVYISEDHVCAFTEDPENPSLMVFEPGASGRPEPPRVIVNGLSLESGTRFRSGPITEIPGGFDCGNNHYEDAVHVIGEVTLDG